MITIHINNSKINVEENSSVLEAALKNGIYIPHLCHHPDLPELGACRLCIVEIEGEVEPQTSCSYQVRDGMHVHTNTERVDHLRRLAMELLLAAHPEHCTSCPKYGRCEMQLLKQSMDVTAARMHMRIKKTPSNDHPLFIHEMSRCVLCGRCVRACNDLRGVGTLQYNKKELEIYVGTLYDKLLTDSDCRFCGACAEVCPTGAIRDILDYNATEKKSILLPCVDTCPAHTDIPAYLRFARDEEYDKAIAVIREKLPFPECLGRICNHKCESNCRRGEVNDAISIREVKRTCAERDTQMLWKKNTKQSHASGKKAAIIGGGPAGLTAAIYLAKQGHSVTVFEAQEKLGGQMQYGIPAYRLPRDVVDKETGYVYELGIDVKCGKRIDEPVKLLHKYDVVLVATGTHHGIRLPIEGNELPGVLINTDFLRKAAMKIDTGMGKRVCVLGGGNVAFDCARTASRLGAEEVYLACLEPREKMLADFEEIEAAITEGVNIHAAHSFEKICGKNAVTGMVLSKVKRFSFDENQQAIIEKETDSSFTLAVDTVVFAVGQRTGLDNRFGLALSQGGMVLLSEEGKTATSVSGVFACGDVVTGTRSVIEAIASARQAASEIDIFLGGDGDIDEKLLRDDSHEAWIGKIEGFAHFEQKKSKAVEKSEGKIVDFNQISLGLCNDTCEEAGRCLQCDLRFDIQPSRPWTAFSGTRGSGEHD